MGETVTILERLAGQSLQTAVLEGNRLAEYFTGTGEEVSQVGTILLGKVERVLPDVRAAFVNIGRGKNGFLPLKESDSFHQQNDPCPLVTGNGVVVQIRKDEKGAKGAYLSRDVSLPGQYVILMPLNRFVGVSKKITEEASRRQLVSLGEEIAARRFGLVMREAALPARREDIAREAESLYEAWQQLSRGVECQKPPCVLSRPERVFETVFRDLSPKCQVQAFSTLEPSSLVSPEDMEEKWKAFRIREQLPGALGRKVTFSGGGFLVIDEREALQTIDVNSGSFVKTQGSLALAVNLAACGEIARQIRLRNLSGIVLIDFIDMATEKEREQVAEALEKELKQDRIKTVVHGFTRLGLLEMTRRRTGPSLSEMLRESEGREED